jgi:hypothetical protein
MRRREFITLAGGAVAAWPLAARAQEPRVIGVLSSFGLSGFFVEVLIPAFSQGLKDAGYMEGRNISIEMRLADDHYDRLPSLAAELVRREVAAIYTPDLPAALAAKAATQTILGWWCVCGSAAVPVGTKCRADRLVSCTRRRASEATANLTRLYQTQPAVICSTARRLIR